MTSLTTRRALLRLLIRNQGQVVTVDDVCHELGRRVSRQAVSNAAQRLAADIPLVANRGRTGGYVLEKAS